MTEDRLVQLLGLFKQARDRGQWDQMYELHCELRETLIGAKETWPPISDEQAAANLDAHLDDFTDCR